MARLSRLNTFIAAVVMCLPWSARADTGLKWNPGPVLTSQNATYTGVLLSDSQMLLLSKNAADGTGKTIELRVSTDFATSFVQTVSSPNTGLASAIPGILSAINIPAVSVLLAAGPGATPATSFIRGTTFNWAFPAVTISPGGLTNTTAHSLLVQGGTILALLQTSAGGYICRSANNGLTVTCQQPTGFGSVAAPTAVGGLGTLQGIASPALNTWLVLDNANTLWKSTDDGLTFANMTQLSTNSSINALICLGLNSCVALVSSPAATQVQMFRSTNVGNTWISTFNIPRGDRFTNLLSVGQGVIVALGDPTQTAIPFGFRSTDFGQTWQVIPPASIANPLATSSFIAHVSVFSNSTGSGLTISNFCTAGGTCNTAVVIDPLSADQPSASTVGQGTPAIPANRWPVYLSDGTNPLGTSTNPLFSSQGGATTQTNRWPVYLSDGTNPLGTSTNPLFSSQGAAATQANRWPVYLSDGTNPLGSSTNPVITGPQRSGSLTALADVSCAGISTLLRIGITNRISLLCTNNDGSVNVRVGDITVSSTKGVRLRAGSSLSVAGTYPVYCISEGAAVAVSCSEETP